MNAKCNGQHGGSRAWETKIRNQGAQCEYEHFADELMRDQLIAGLTSGPLPVKPIGKGHTGIETQHNRTSLYEKSLK